MIKNQSLLIKSAPITLTWQDITAKVKDKSILTNVSGYSKPGQMLAIMGPSGAGKTTLLSLLAEKRNSALTVTGEMRVNNTFFNAETFYNFGVYIFQNDILHANLTVRETLQFIAKLQIKDKNVQQQRVNEMISIFQLQKCQDTFVGGVFTKGISGGEKKRLCIAVEMISDPSLLILDEPTSGLDSHKVKGVIKVLKKLAHQKNKTIIFTLHQPSFFIYKELDRLMLLNRGQVIFQGFNTQIYDYMQNVLKITISHQCSLSDFFMMQISEYKKSKNDYMTPLNNENYCKYLELNMLTNFNEARDQIEVEGFQTLSTTKNFLEQFTILITREWLTFRRNPMKGIRILFMNLFVTFIVGTVFLNGVGGQHPIDGQIYDSFTLLVYFLKAQGVSYVGSLFSIMGSCNMVVLQFPNEKQIYYKQTSSKKYRPISYLISKIMIETSSMIVGSLIFGTGQYILVAYTWTVLQYAKFSLVFVLVVCSFVGNSLGLLVGTCFQDGRRASALTPLILMPLMMFSGMYNRLDSIQPWISWVQYISPFKYALHAMLLNQFEDAVYITQLGVYNYKSDLMIQMSYGENVLILGGLAVLFYGMAFVLLKKLSSNLAP